jgi:hypothetical protein
MMEAGSSSETSVNFYQTALSNFPEDSHLHTRRRENLKLQRIILLSLPPSILRTYTHTGWNSHCFATLFVCIFSNYLIHAVLCYPNGAGPQYLITDFVYCLYDI